MCTRLTANQWGTTKGSDDDSECGNDYGDESDVDDGGYGDDDGDSDYGDDQMMVMMRVMLMM